MSHAFRQIVLGFDFSTHARAALDAALSLASRLHSHVHVVTAAAGAVDDAVVDSVSETDDRALRTAFLGRLESYVRMEVDPLVGSRVTVDYRINMGPAAPTLLAAASELRADLLVLGAVGNRPAAAGARVGVDVLGLCRATRCPLLVVRQECPFPPRRTLSAVDFSSSSAAALRMAAEMAQLGNGQLDIVHVLAVTSDRGLGGLARFLPEEVRQARREVTERQLSDYLRELDLGLEVSHADVVEAAPAEVILSRLMEADYDLLALGTVGRREPNELVLGETAERVIRAATTNLLIVPRRQPRDGPPENWADAHASG